MKSQAVLIGGCRYRELGDLEAVHNNLTELASELCADSVWGLPESNCVAVEDPETAADMLNPLVEAAKNATDTLLLYYAGHGLVDERGELYLALSGSAADPERIYLAVPYRYIRDILLRACAARRIVILDCCYSGRALGQMAATSSAVADEASAEGTYVLAATAENKSALAPPGQPHTAFTGELLSILRNGITDGGPLLDLDSIYSQLRKVARSKGFPEPQQRNRNTAGRLTLVRNRAKQTDHVSPPNADHYNLVLQQIEEGYLVLFLGSPVAELADDLAERFDLKGKVDLPDIAEYIYLTGGRFNLSRALRQTLEADRDPGPVHRFLARLPRTFEGLGLEKRYQLIVSTSFGMELERAFDAELEPYDLAIYMASGPDAGKFVHFPYGGSPEPIANPDSYAKFPVGTYDDLERTVIVKPYGAVDGNFGGYRWKENYIITDDNYINYLSESPIESLVPVQILELLRDSHCLFLGYSVRDWRQCVFLNRVWRGSGLTARSWAVEPEPDLLAEQSWAQKHVQLYRADLSQYVDQLQRQLTGRRA